MINKRTILLVDNDPTFLETTKIALEQHYNIRTAKDGNQCLEEVEKEQPDLIILDVMMRHLGEGINVANKLKGNENTKKIPIIMLTAVNKVYDLSAEVEHSLYQKSNTWLEKPVEHKTLLYEVEKLIGE